MLSTPKREISRCIALGAALGAPLMLSACPGGSGGGGDDDPDPPPADAYVLSISPTTQTGEVGDVLSFAVMAMPTTGGEARDVTAEARWSAFPQTTLESRGSGQVALVGVGEGIVSAEWEGLGAVAEVMANGLVTLSASPEVVQLVPGTTANVRLHGRRNTGETIPLTSGAGWTSEDPMVARVTDAGDVEAMAIGSTTLTAEVGSLRAQVLVEVRNGGLTISPTDGEAEVAVTRETIIDFDRPLAQTTDPAAGAIFAEAGGERLDVRVHVSPDRTRVSLYYASFLPAATQVRVTVRGDELIDDMGRAVDADGDGALGGTGVFAFQTLSITPIPGTAVRGRVFASTLGSSGGATVDEPLVGATVTIDGIDPSQLSAVTDEMGNFRLEPVPGGLFFVHIDGRTATNPVEEGAYYPYVGKTWESTPGQDREVGDVFLPLVPAGTLVEVSATEATDVRMAPSMVAGRPELADVRITVPPNSLFADDGTRGGRVGIAPVPPDRLPGPLPETLNFPIVITVQTDGPTNFDAPVPACFPNLPDPETGETLAPGELTILWSFDHDKGRFEPVGPARVTEDGRLACSEPGVGIRAPGWHGTVRTAGLGTQVFAFCFSDDFRALELESCFSEVAEAGQDIREIIGSNVITFYEDSIVLLLGGIVTAVAPGGVLVYAVGATVIVTSYRLYRDCVSGDSPSACLVTGASSSIDATRILEAMGRLSEHAARSVPVLGAAISTLQLQDARGRLSRRIEDCCQLARAYGDRCVTSAEVPAICGSANVSGGYFERMDELLAGLTEHRDLLQRLGESADAFIAYVRQMSEDPDPSQLAEMDELFSTVESILGSLAGAPDVFRLAGHFRRSERTLQSGLFGPYLLPCSAAYLRLDASVNGRNTTTRTRTNAAGIGQARLGLDATNISGTSFCPARGTVSSFGLRSVAPSPGVQSFAMNWPRLPTPDTDSDGLADVAEEIVGTSSTTADTDGDGVFDGTEIENGTNPLDGIIGGTGIMGSLPTNGSAVDVCVDGRGLAAVGTTTGVELVNVFGGMAPVRLARVPLPASALVACGTGRVLASLGSQGLAIIDTSDPSTARVERRLQLGNVRAAAQLSSRFAVAGLSTGRVVRIDIEEGVIVDTVDVPGGIQDLAVQQGLVYALAQGRLTVLTIEGEELVTIGGVTLRGTTIRERLRLFPGQGRLYATHARGVEIIDSTDPRQPRVLRDARDGQLGWRQLVDAGSGLGVAASGANTTGADIQVFDLDASELGAPLFEVQTPGIATAVTVYEGRAFVADGSSGLQVVGFLPFDTARRPPTVRLRSEQLAATSSRAEEGADIRVWAEADDDVQVRRVAFLVDGVERVADGTFPFEARIVAPELSETSTGITIRARGFDTAGNSALSRAVLVTLVPDATPPRVVGFDPRGTLLSQVTELRIRMSEPVDPQTVTDRSIEVQGPGPDGVFDTADDTLTRPDGFSLVEEGRTIVASFMIPLASGRHRLRVQAPLADRAGNQLAASRDKLLRVFDRTDSDGDGVPDEVEREMMTDPLNPDSNMDGIPDGEDDFDRDGLPNAFEAFAGLDPTSTDSDGDGTPDGQGDEDGDGLTNAQEAALGSSPVDVDTDLDGFPDLVEAQLSSNPADSQARPAMPVSARDRATVLRLAPITESGPSSVVTQQDVTVVLPASGQLPYSVVRGAPPVTAQRTATATASFGIFRAQPPVSACRGTCP